jgi:hypothetical protein
MKLFPFASFLHTFLLSSLLLVTLGNGKPQEKPSMPLNPFRLKYEEFKAGNPLAMYAEQLRLEREFFADAALKSSYLQARGTVASYLGDVLSANRDWNLAFPPPSARGPVLTTQIDGMHPVSALDVITRAADRHRWIMFGEEHLKPQTRSLLIPVLRALKKKGFRYLAAETFNANVAETVRGGFPTYETGTYTADPVFAAGVREAIRLGYTLIPYEEIGKPTEVPKDDPEFLQNFREHGQAKHLKERIFDKDPHAKVIVWAGRAHILEVENVNPDKSVWRPMAHEFRKLTGEDPFTVYLATYTEQSERRYERPEYKYATDRGLVKQPVIFASRDGKFFGSPFDVQVFFPRTTLVYGRPDWLVREMGRKVMPLPSNLIKTEGVQLAQAFKQSEPVTAIPLDQCLLLPGEPVPALMLPPGETYQVRVIDTAGVESGRTTVTVPR